MANKKHLKILEQGVEIWNKWRQNNPEIKPDLRGVDFRGADFRGADFSGALIQGTNFTKTKLKNANFSSAEAGLTRLGVIGLLIGLVLFSILLGFIFLYLASLLGYFVTPEAIEKNSIIPELFAVALFIFLASVVIRFGLKLESIGFILILITSLATLGLFFTVANVWTLGRDEVAALIVPVLAFFVAATSNAFAIVTAKIVDGKIWGGQKARFFPLIGVLVGIWGGSQIDAVDNAIQMAGPGYISRFTVNIYVKCMIITWILATLSVSIYLARSTVANQKKNALIFEGAVNFVAIGGTCFREADLSDSDFTNATLKSTDFRDANITHTCWKNTKKLDQARTGTSYLQYQNIRQLLMTREGQDKNFDRLNLRGINLEGANLQDASFIGTDLNRANLQNANLSRAKLVQSLLEGADLTRATLTKAYIEDWGISNTTKLIEINCDCIFLKLPTKLDPNPRRRPADESQNFKPGEFAKLVQRIPNTVDLVFKDGIDWRTFLKTFQELRVESERGELPVIQTIENKGDGAFVIRVKVSVQTDEAEYERKFLLKYNRMLKAKNKEIKLLNQERENIRKENTELIGVVKTMADKQDTKYDLRNAIFGGGFVGRDQTDGTLYDYSTNLETKQNLTEAAQEIQQLLEQLSQTYPISTKAEQMVVATEAIKRIEGNPTLMKRILDALKAGGISALAQLLNHPATSFVIAALEDLQNSKEG